MALTGRFWFRKSWTGRLVLLVEEERPRRFGGGAGKPRWRDARLLDFAEPALRPLMTVEQAQRAGATPRGLRAVPTPVAPAKAAVA